MYPAIEIHLHLDYVSAAQTSSWSANERRKIINAGV
jgi:hypothetical protein